MKRVFVAALAMTVSGAAVAADLPVRPEPIIVAEPFTWTGFYVGIQGGYGFGNSDVNVDVDGVNRFLNLGALGAIDTDYDIDGGIIGGYAGYNWQFDAFVLGAEADFEWSGISGHYAASFDRRRGRDIRRVTAETDFNWQGSVRARAGYAVDRALFYATGGLAFANVDDTYRIRYVDAAGAFRTASVNESGTDIGWTVGAGLEYAWTDNIIGRVEYRYTSIGGNDVNFGGVLNNVSIEGDRKFNAIRGGFSWKF